MDEQSKSVLTLTFYFTFFIAMIASIKFDIGFLKFTLLKWAYSTSFIWHFNTYIAAILKLFLAIVTYP
jgi:hypothetical protein